MNTRLYVGNLSFHTDESVLRAAFEACGEVVDAKIITDRDTGRSRGFAFVTMANEEASRKAVETLGGHDLDGRELRVNEAEERRPRTDGGSGYGGGNGRGRDGGNRW
jgi:cold-inducible RNA-binding protein